MFDLLVVDATVLISALLRGRARDILVNPTFTFVTTEFTTWEVMKYVPFIAEKIRLSEPEIVEAFKALPIIACQGREYDYCMDSARDLIGNRDPRDADILALAISLDVSLWSDDRDFEGITSVTLLRTTDMLARIRGAAS